QKGIDDIAQHFLQKEGISAVRRAKKSDIDKLAKSTGAKIVSRINDLTAGDVGDAGLVEERKVGNENMVFVEGTKKSSAVTIICRGGSEHVIDEIERALDDAIGAVIAVIKDGKLVAGGGSAEAEIAYKLREYSKTVGGREQLAIDAFAETLEIIPRTLAETAGMDPLDTIVSLRSKHSEKNNKYIGVDVFKAKLSNMKELNVVEPLAVKIQAINSATEVSEMLLRIDDIIAGTSKSKGMPQMPPGMGGGMGDY
ncbi:MAG: TCP-1/cpn60 chaperonin family protein, partial [Candidatus Diapherotrites archaeon]|nr:TCP-1/cpn60 chaperonin family protein [Candidatus Diapherotrites archaeon]